jgi:capsular polysaccharide biosynthesis protein
LKYQIPYPINLPESKQALFKEFTSYTIEDPKVVQEQGVFVSHYGIGIKHGLLLRGTVPNSFGKGKPNWYGRFWRKGIEQYLVCRFGKSLPSRHLEAPQTYILAHAPWFNYFFWVTESLPRIMHAQAWHAQSKLILPESIARRAFVQESLKLFPELQTAIIPADEHLFIDRLVLPRIKNWNFRFRKEELQALRKAMVAEAARHASINLGERIYLSREKASYRHFTNAAEVEAVLSEYGFTKVCFEDYSIWEQVQIMQQARYFVAAHGAGLTNILWMPAGGKFLELYYEVQQGIPQRYSYWTLSNVLGIDYYIQYCPVQSGHKADLFANLAVDIAALRANLNHMFDKS